MNSLQLLERINKVEDRITKREKTKQCYVKKIEKTEAQISSETDPQQKRFLECDLKYTLEDQRRLSRKADDDEALLNKYREQLARQLEIEHCYKRDLPDSLKELESSLAETWYKWDLQRRERVLKTDRRDRSRAEHLFLEKSDADLRKKNAADARAIVIDLYHMVYSKTGEVTSWSNLKISGNAINGIVQGTAGAVRVESILAGGYNIQRLHVRVLVHSIDQ